LVDAAVLAAAAEAQRRGGGSGWGQAGGPEGEGEGEARAPAPAPGPRVAALAASDGPWVYLLRCGDGSLYCGWTTDVARRLAEHQAGKASRYTRSRLPVELAWSRPVASREEALREERRIKGFSRAEKLRLLASV